MFVIAKKNFRIRRADGSLFMIRKDYIGEIPQDVADHWLVQAALADGSIATPLGRKDRQLEAADAEAAARAADADIRPDAHPDAGMDQETGADRKAGAGQGDGTYQEMCIGQGAGVASGKDVGGPGQSTGKKETKTKK